LLKILPCHWGRIFSFITAPKKSAISRVSLESRFEFENIAKELQSVRPLKAEVNSGQTDSYKEKRFSEKLFTYLAINSSNCAEITNKHLFLLHESCTV
jgi:hypothetical protein